MNHTELTQRTLRELTSLEAHLDAHEFGSTMVAIQRGDRKRDIAGNLALGGGVVGAGVAGVAGVRRYGGDFKKGYSRARASRTPVNLALPGRPIGGGSLGAGLQRGFRGAYNHAGADARKGLERGLGAAKEGVMRGKDFLSASVKRLLSRGKA